MKISSIRNDFPVFEKNKNLTYLDSAATALKPKQVIDSVVQYYSEYPSNVFRGLYPLSQRATEAYEKAREKVAQFIHAHSPSEIIFTRGTTESINFIAYAWGRLNIHSNDEIVTTIMEHHSNFVPWQELVRENGAVLKVIDIDDSNKDSLFRIEKTVFSKITTNKTKLVAITHVSNVLGTINPIKEIIAGVKRINPHCLVLVDGAQAVPHMSVDVQDLGCDFYVFSGHKMMGPTGIGVLWIRKELLEIIPPFHFFLVTYKTGAIGLGAAIDYMNTIGVTNIQKHEMALTEYTLKRLNDFGSITMYCPQIVRHRGGVLSFNLYDSENHLIHPHDVGDVLGLENICVRAGHHCAMPLATRLGIPASVRVSLHIYNDKKDIDRLIEGLEKVRKIFK
ncbi:MAG: SufS subfamily cysteine desulfurase, cysteine desulfurase / selenocysteine lyase [Microgenomates group bacterium GW2011_GWC1_41_8]|nr:MAG: SufS subfamily cysteine desulfurase, cysteine desulfurase / selenocysteine lyase [Microgenomates group bacterium GW2011_GWC1_41_8]